MGYREMGYRSRRSCPFEGIAAKSVATGQPTNDPGNRAPVPAVATAVAVPGRVGKDPAGLYRLLAAVRGAGGVAVKTAVVAGPLVPTDDIWPVPMVDIAAETDGLDRAMWDGLDLETWSRAMRRNRTTH